MKNRELVQILKAMGKSERERFALTYQAREGEFERIMERVNVLMSQRQQMVETARQEDTPVSFRLHSLTRRGWGGFLNLISSHARPHFRFVPQAALALSAILVIAASALATATPEDKSLYLAKRMLVKARAVVTGDRARQTEFELARLESRVSELRALPVASPARSVESVLAEVNESAGEVNRGLASLGEKRKPRAFKVALQASDQAELSRQALQALRSMVAPETLPRLNEADKKLYETKLIALRVLVTYSDWQDESAAAPIVKAKLANEISSVEGSIEELKSLGRDAGAAQNIRMGLARAEEAIKEGKLTIALDSIIAASAQLDEVIDDPEHAEEVLGENVIEDGPEFINETTTDVAIGLGETGTSTATTTIKEVHSALPLPKATSSDVTRAQPKKPGSVYKAEPTTDEKNKPPPEYPVGFDL